MVLIFSILCLAMAAENFASICTTDYCNIKCEDEVHTMCMYRSSTPGKLCREWSSQGFNNDEKKVIVETHNELRKAIASNIEKRGKNGPQPVVVHYPNMTWDKELETIAQRWANQCLDYRDDCRDVERFAVGQILRSSSDKNESTFEKMIQSWYDDVINLDRYFTSAFPDSDGLVERYMQIVWTNITKVGCGQIKYKKPNGWTMKTFVCNYGPMLKKGVPKHLYILLWGDRADRVEQKSSISG